MNARTDLARHSDQRLLPDSSRVIMKLYFPGEEIATNHSRVGIVVDRVMSIDEVEIESLASDIVNRFGARHSDLVGRLKLNASRVASRIAAEADLSEARTTVMGAAFSAEFAVEGAALCNPSVVAHPDQSGLTVGELRVAVSLRCIGEGHQSSIGFATAVISADRQWLFDKRQSPLTVGVPQESVWDLDAFRSVLEGLDLIDDAAHNALAELDETFIADDLQRIFGELPPDLARRPFARESFEALLRVAASRYESRFPDDLDLSQQILMHVLDDERSGIEDARFVLFTETDGTTHYRATYTAFNGRDIACRMLKSEDLHVFTMMPISGPSTRNKGMALFPRRIGGEFVAMCRSDGETNSITRSADGVRWGEPVVVHEPLFSWEFVQVGNCGSPIETKAGWLVLTHGVGAMRTYAIGAMLLDLDDPERVIARLEGPLLSPILEERDGYVPNVVYSCGGVVHDNTLWLPYGIDDSRIGVASVDIEELLHTMTPVAS